MSDIHEHPNEENRHAICEPQLEPQPSEAATPEMFAAAMSGLAPENIMQVGIGGIGVLQVFNLFASLIASLCIFPQQQKKLVTVAVDNKI